jgi:translation initiation factor 2A
VRYQKETWPNLKFVGDDDLAFRSNVPGQIEVLNPKNNFEVIKVIETKPFDIFNVSPKRENLIIVCVSLEKSAGYDKHEGKVEVYEYDNLGPNPSVTKILDKAHEVNLFFSPNGQNLLVWAQTFTDKTGQSYYGEHVLLYLDMTKKVLRRVPTYKGPIHDVAWNPNSLEFIVISGFMPGYSVLFTSQCVPKFEFGHHHRNTIKWSPLSRFVILGGFGNLSGDMDIWEVTTLQKVGSCKSNSAVSCLWSPDGRRILTGVLNPRLRVDNCYKVFKYTGEQLNSVDFSHTELYEVMWRPGNYVDKPCTPVNKNEKKEEEKKQKGFSSGSFAAQLKAQKESKSAGRHLTAEETFGNEANIEVEEKKEEQPKKKKRIRKKKDKKGDDDKEEDEGDEK